MKLQGTEIPDDTLMNSMKHYLLQELYALVQSSQYNVQWPSTTALQEYNALATSTNNGLHSKALQELHALAQSILMAYTLKPFRSTTPSSHQ